MSELKPFKIEVDIEQSVSFLEKMFEKTENFSRFLSTSAKDILKEENEKFFRLGIDPEGVPWVPNKKRTKTLWMSGALQQDLQKDSNYFVKGLDLFQQSTKVYAPTHHFGLAINIFGRGTLYQFPERRHAGISNDGIKAMLISASNWILNK